MPKWLDILKTVGPMVISIAVPVAGPVIAGAIVHGIESAEAMKGASSAEKRQHAIEIAVAAAEGTNAAAGKTVVSTTGLADAVGEAIDTTVDTVNLIHAGHGAA